jgi:hypothetical protein
MERAGDQFFTGTAFTTDQYRRLGGRQLAQQLAQFANGFAVAKQLVFRLINVNRALPTQARHPERSAQRHLNPGHIEWQGMEIEEPFADKVPDILQSKDFLVEYGDPLGTATADELFDGFRVFELKGLQTQQADIAGFVGNVFQGAAVNVPTHRAQTRQQTITVVARVHY